MHLTMACVCVSRETGKKKRPLACIKLVIRMEMKIAEMSDTGQVERKVTAWERSYQQPDPQQRPVLPLRWSVAHTLWGFCGGNHDLFLLTCFLRVTMKEKTLTQWLHLTCKILSLARFSIATCPSTLLERWTHSLRKNGRAVLQKHHHLFFLHVLFLFMCFLRAACTKEI